MNMEKPPHAENHGVSEDPKIRNANDTEVSISKRVEKSEFPVNTLPTPESKSESPDNLTDSDNINKKNEEPEVLEDNSNQNQQVSAKKAEKPKAKPRNRGTSGSKSLSSLIEDATWMATWGSSELSENNEFGVSFHGRKRKQRRFYSPEGEEKKQKKSKTEHIRKEQLHLDQERQKTFLEEKATQKLNLEQTLTAEESDEPQESQKKKGQDNKKSNKPKLNDAQPKTLKVLKNTKNISDVKQSKSNTLKVKIEEKGKPTKNKIEAAKKGFTDKIEKSKKVKKVSKTVTKTSKSTKTELSKNVKKTNKSKVTRSSPKQKTGKTKTEKNTNNEKIGVSKTDDEVTDEEFDVGNKSIISDDRTVVDFENALVRDNSVDLVGESCKSEEPQVANLRVKPALKNANISEIFASFLGEEDKDEISSVGRLFIMDAAITSSQDVKFEANIILAKDFIQRFKERYVPYFKEKSEDQLLVRLDSVVFPFLKEEYLLLNPKDEELDPLYEIGRTMRIISLMYLPKQHQLEVINAEQPNNCILGQYVEAMEAKNFDKLLESIALFNFLLLKLQRQGVIQDYLSKKTTISKAFIHELLCQIYARTVSPLSRKLRKYKAFSNNVYGEILPNFFSEMMNKVGATHKHTFLDLGSGVGNCTIQAALEFGCKSYGAEIMEDASTACELQENEFNERCKFYGLLHGDVKFFLRESFIGHEGVLKVIPDIDVVLVNNYVFNDELNEQVGMLLNGLKPGAKIISLKNLVKPGHTITQYNIASIVHKLVVEELLFLPGSVSWTNSGGKYFISTVSEKYQQSVWNDHSLTRTRSHRIKA